MESFPADVGKAEGNFFARVKVSKGFFAGRGDIFTQRPPGDQVTGVIAVSHVIGIVSIRNAPIVRGHLTGKGIGELLGMG